MQQYQDIYVFIEQCHGAIAPVGYELLAEAKKLASKVETKPYKVVGVLLGHGVGDYARDVIAHGADRVVVCEDSKLESYSTQYYTDALVQILEHYQPDAVLIGATVVGRDLAPRVAARLDTGLTADATKIEIDTTDQKTSLLVTRPAFGGNLFATIVCKTWPQMASIRPNVMVAMKPDHTRKGEIIVFAPVLEHALQIIAGKKITKEEVHVDITKANLILSCGRGMIPYLAQIEAYARELHATVAVSRAVVDQGMAPKEIQVGQTGKTVRPTIYIACGISGAAQHIAGIEHSDMIIAINIDPQAAIFQVANLGFVGDAMEILPLVVEELKQLRQSSSTNETV